MDSIKNYPWAGVLEVSQDAFNQWQNSPQQTGFTFWALRNKAISRRKYFDWAINYYQTPFLEDRFFEQYTMKKKEWKKIKDLFQWTPEILPVAVFNDLIFIGCVDPQIVKDRLPFKNRLLLTSDHTLQINWNFSKELSQMIDNKMDITQVTQTNAIREIQKTPLKKATESSSVKVSKKAFKGLKVDLKLKPLSLKVNSAGQSSPSFAVQQNPPSQESKGNHQGKNKPLKEKSLSHKPPLQENSSNSTSSHFVEPNKLKLEDLPEATHSISLKEECYSQLWPKIKSYFCGALILEVEENKIYPLSWTGRIIIEDKKNILLDLNNRSLFTVIQRGHPYHGAVTDIPTNKSFFKKIGWNSYPKHITTLSIYKEKGQLKHIFIGCSPNTLSKPDIQAVEQIINAYSLAKIPTTQAAS